MGRAFCYNKFCIEINNAIEMSDTEKDFAITNFVLK